MLAEVGARGTRELVDGMSEELIEMNLAAKTDGNPNRVFLLDRGKYVPFIREGIPEPDVHIKFDHDGVRIEKVTIDFQKQIDDTARRIAANLETSVLLKPPMVKALAARGFVLERTCRNVSETDYGFKCSFCGDWEDIDHPRYCAHCGAKVVE